MATALAFATFAAPVRADDARWGRWAPADDGSTPFDFRTGLHVTHVTLRDTSVGGGRVGRDYGFDQPTVFVPELAFSAMTSRHVSLGLVLQPIGFGAQDVDAPADAGAARYTRTPFVLGLGALVEGAWSFGSLLVRPRLATGPRVLFLSEDRTGRQSPPTAAQWFLHGRLAAEIELARWLALGAGASTDVIRPLDWGAFGYVSWRTGDFAAATR